MIMTASAQFPVLLQDDPDAVVQRVRLALPALLAPQVEDRAGILRHLLAHDLGRVVGAGVVDDVDAPRPGRIVDAHQRIDAGAQHVGLVPRRQHESHARRVVLAPRIVVPDAVRTDDQELGEGRQRGHHAQRDQSQAKHGQGVRHR
jgi:hypothetical protein